ncbi:hypothetical protein [Mycolicibacterium aubagnense]|uniref:EF-hand domain-containing protein n=1 Tax=Mycolicibacterium aubagnense TaxID=319707 RepID=A0ABM7IKP5_9MYCO|nr:hypothetical protein [Mycolicibacterium aubagnense]WGI31233.1 hypothetical protein QDT91_18495 [Mycolicibacterium aubagnense]BBX87363.1 hypothetical protein MAUB_52360 [Mycolicibacterium aubagnense]
MTLATEVCPNGHPNPQNQHFCGDCGARIRASTERLVNEIGAKLDDFESGRISLGEFQGFVDHAESALPETAEISGSASKMAVPLANSEPRASWPSWPPNAQTYYRPTLIAAVAASAGVMIGTVGPWASVLLFSLSGLDAGDTGKTALAFGAVACVGLLIVLFWPRTRFNPRWALPLAWFAAVAGVSCVTFAILTLIRIITIPKARFFGIPIGASAGWGLWLLAFSSAVLCVTAAIVATEIARYVDVIQYRGRPQTAWTHGWRRASVIASAAIVISIVADFSTHWGNDSSGSGQTSPMESTSVPSFPSFTALPSFPNFPSLPSSSVPTHASTPSSRPTVPEPATPTAVPTDPESDSFSQLKAIANDDRHYVANWLADQWVPQLSSKRPGLVAEGIVWDNTTTLREYLQLRQKYPGARLLWSGDWSTFSSRDFWVTVAGVGFSDPDNALAWCTDHNLDRDHCYAKLISTTQAIDGSTRYN